MRRLMDLSRALGACAHKLSKWRNTYDAQFEAMHLAKTAGKVAELPDYKVRMSRAADDRRKLEELNGVRNKIGGDAISLYADLRPYEYSERASDVSARNELRGILRNTKDDKERMRLMEDQAFRRAALESGLPAVVSGLTQATRDRIHASELSERFPVQVKAYQDWQQADSILAQTMKTVETAIGNELKACGVNDNPLDKPVKVKQGPRRPPVQFREPAISPRTTIWRLTCRQ
jgi:hypothetical protein